METTLTTKRSDRSTYAMATAILGVAVGTIMVLTRDLDSTLVQLLVYIFFFALVIGSQEWVDRTTQTIPRHSKRHSTFGLVASMLVALAVALPWLNWSAQTKPPSTAMQLVASVAVALPCWIAALVIYRNPK